MNPEAWRKRRRRNQDPISLSSNEEEYEGSDTPSQSDPVDKPETLPFQINPPTTRLTPEGPIARPKYKAIRKQSTRDMRKRHRG